MAQIRKNCTKAELLEMIERREEEIKALKTDIDRLEKYKQYDDMANELYAAYESLKNSGFDDEKAYEIFKIMLQTATVNAAANANRSSSFDLRKFI